MPPEKVHRPDPVEVKVLTVLLSATALLMVRGLVLVWLMAVTFVPMTALIVMVPEPAPELVIVPVLFTLAVESVAMPVLLELRVRLPVPVIPPVKVILSSAVAEFTVRS